MSKMEEKLKASIRPKQPVREQPQPEAIPPAKVAKVAQVAVGEADLNAPDTTLHPQRIWPD